MNKEQARNLVRQTLTESFDKARFRTFVLELLNEFDESKAFASNKTYIKDAFKNHVERFERLGTYTSPDDEKLDVLIVHLTKQSKLERARTAIRNFVADHLKQRDGKDAALVAFVSPTEKQWRFSYVKMEYATVEKDSGKVGVETKLTPARRFSYIVGEGESCHTAQTRFLDLLEEPERGEKPNPTLAQVEEAFSVEAVTKEFFKKYAELFEEIKAALDKLAKKDPTIGKELEKKNVRTADFAKKLMGQIVFLYFIQKKGWLGVERGKDWGTGPHDFLRQLADGNYGKYDNLFNDILEPLFYDTLATDRGHDGWCKRFNCRIPFLNGGLFEPPGDYNWCRTDIVLANRLFTNNERVDDFTTGTGLLDMFDRYNFTVNEAEPLEKEVAIDPEMLGKVFENLIEENLRKGLGSYYTPREIVHYMCQESLINYLDTAVNSASEPIGREKRKQADFGDEKAEQSLLTASTRNEIVPRADIETFVHLGEQAAFFENARISGTKSYARHLPKAIEQNARVIDDKLAEIAICDPAVGSGAFPVGMMTEIVRARSALTPYFNERRERTAYRFKHDAIQNCLYGVDIDPGAVEIAKLRLWLSLVVDEEDVARIKPLPNLSYKIVVGNSLLQIERTELENWKALHRLEELKPIFFDESHGDRKEALKNEIDELIRQLSRGEEIFDFRVFFSEVFHRKGGFDVMIANPPYGSDLSSSAKASLAKRFPFVPDYESADYFVCISLGNLRNGGTKCFIMPNTWLVNRFAKKFRKHLLENYRIITIADCSGFSIFESATVRNSITLFSNAKPSHSDTANFAVFSPQGLSGIKSIPLNELQMGIDNWLTYFSAADSALALARKVRDTSTRLDNFSDSSQGLIPYDKYRGHDEHTIKNRIWHAATQKDKTYKRELKGKDVSRYVVNWNGKTWISYGTWLAAPREPRFFTSKRILIREITNPHIIAAYTEKEFYNTPSIINVTGFRKLHPFYLLGLINSKLLSFVHVETSPKSKKGLFPKILVDDVRNLPIKDPASTEERSVVSAVAKVIAAKQRNPDADTSALEREIDQLVYALYDLTPEEIQIVENSAKQTPQCQKSFT